MIDAEMAKATKRRFHLRHRERLNREARERHAANKEKRNAYCRAYALRNRDKIRAQQAESRKVNGVRRRAHRREKYYEDKYGLTLQQYDEMLASQGGCCALCRTSTPDGPWHKFSVDHDHVTGVLRGLLCRACNVGLGAFADNESTLAAAAYYVMRHRRATA